MQASFEILVLEVEGIDAGFCEFDLVEVRVDGGSLGLSEADEVDDVGEDFDETVMGGAEEVGEGEVGDTTLGVDRSVFVVQAWKVCGERDLGLYSLRREASATICRSP